MIIRQMNISDKDEWLRMRKSLWPDCTEARHKEEMEAMVKGDPIINETAWLVLFAAREGGGLGGFIEASVHPEDELPDSAGQSPLGYIEGWYVDPDLRGKGLGRRLVRDAEKWAVTRGCAFMGTDAQLDNEISIGVYKALGYIEVSRSVEVNLRKRLL